MNLQDEAAWVFGLSPHTGQPKTAHAFPVNDTDRALCDFGGTIEEVLDHARRTKFRVGASYCIKPERGDPPLGHVRITSIDHWPLLARWGSHESMLFTHRCGYDSLGDFVLIWSCLHDHEFYREEIIMDINDEGKAPQVWAALQERPPELYQAWLINFEPVEIE